MRQKKAMDTHTTMVVYAMAVYAMAVYAMVVYAMAVYAMAVCSNSPEKDIMLLHISCLFLQ